MAGPQWWQQQDRPYQYLSDIGELHELRHSYADALVWYSRAVDDVERRRRHLRFDEQKTAFSGIDDVQRVYFLGVRAALRASKSVDDPSEFHEKAFELSEKARARGLLDLMASNAARSHSNASCPPPGGQDVVGTWMNLQARCQVFSGLLDRIKRSGGDDAAEQSIRERLRLGDPLGGVRVIAI